jgi:NAD(P)-dependent dehydrogenase (short-subunit alcohol dehydrogenase family)
MTQENQFTGRKVALITGVSKGGTGEAAALALTRAGWIVYAGARCPDKLADLSAQGITVIRLDVTDEASMRSAVELIERAQGRIDALVNNAAYGEMGAVEDVPLDQVRAQFETNVFGLVRMCQLVLPLMRRQRGGRIVNLSSMGGEMTTPFAGYYHATKYAVESLSDALRMEVVPFGIDVIVIQPGGINTPLAHQTVQSIPLGEASPYRAQLAAFRKVSEAMMGMSEQVNVSPERVAEVIVSTLIRDQPLTRYKVTTQDMDEINVARSAADRERDAALRQQLGLADVEV